MRASSIVSFHQTTSVGLRRPWQTFKDGQIWYGMMKLGSKRHPLTTKQGNKHYYKGTGSSGYGRLNKNGTYLVNWDKVRTYVVPADLNSTELKPLVSPKTPQIYQKYVGYTDGVKSPELAMKNIIDFVELGENYNNVDLEKSNYLEEFVHEDVIKSEMETEVDEPEKATQN